MKRDINLYLEEFQPKPDPLSLPRVMGIWSVLLICLIGLSSWINNKAAVTAAEHKKISQAINQQQMLVTEFESALSERSQDPQLKDTIVNLSREIAQKNAVRQLVTSRKQHNFKFSPLMADLAQYHESAIWLENIIYQQEQIVLQGGAAKVSVIPQWLAGLSQSQYFAGKTFKDLSLNASQNGLYTQFSVASQKPTANSQGIKLQPSIGKLPVVGQL
ncbi:PilN domain-containing protein [Catenovulum agarivorans]|uniref:PilN domain-containing protein n=1 Tax=Catenovulum agarivorans TaxID=1172192 RepID=UPI0002FB84F7|nr:PilN domain-containing protein [Catenovulum agarivorans]